MTYGEKIIDMLIKDHGKDIKIGFLPYKYSMWDSMETVFDAAVEKGLWAKICPVPYMTRADGKWHTEYYYYDAKALTNMDYNAFLEKIDIAVIHNPYDGNNLITSIIPEFYSDKIKKQCLIVYLAYCGSCWGQNFILQNGVKNADYIFTATEDERERYLNVLGGRGIDKRKNVFCVGGLPKYEAILKPRELPRDTNDKLRILVCGGLLPFLNDPGRAEKWKKAIMKYQRDDTEVVFRPHPLLEDGVKSMKPELKESLKEFYEWTQGKCLIDLSQNFQEAIHYADYLVSDPSSVIDTWKASAKGYEVIE